MPRSHKKTQANQALLARNRQPLQARDVNTHLQTRVSPPPKPQVTPLHAQGVNSTPADIQPQDLLRQFGARTGSQQLRQLNQGEEQGNTRQTLQRRLQIQERAQQLPAQEAPPQATPARQIRVLHALVPSPRCTEQRISNSTQRRKQTHGHFEVFQDPPLSPPPQARPQRSPSPGLACPQAARRARTRRHAEQTSITPTRRLQNIMRLKNVESLARTRIRISSQEIRTTTVRLAIMEGDGRLA